MATQRAIQKFTDLCSCRSEEIIIKISKERLTNKQKTVLRMINGLQEQEIITNATKFSEKTTRILECSESTIWSCLKTLRNCELLEYSSKDNKGIPLRLTKIGMKVAEELNKKNKEVVRI
ncbi:hypothetical protein COU61_04905 [Candidatus Pacearchaeota archaeon CG10_big_fil_rev_8_21_14_0_10_35_13]|nr:MAG: hypothetical protein COU61_04905 [Candidatus Pacearchaeota archaeon CG10_big_fil_rev_8_21_14_0_10_35_13]